MEELLSHDIPVTIIPDTSVAHIMSDVDLVLIGAVAVVENGGILNNVGFFTHLRNLCHLDWYISS